MNSAQMSKWPNHLYYIIIMWGRLICIDYFQDFIFRLGILQWVEKNSYGVLLISCKFICKAGTTKEIGKRLEEKCRCVKLLLLSQKWFQPILDSHDRTKIKMKMQIQNDFGHIMTVLYRHRLMQMFGFTEVLLSTYSIYLLVHYTST